MHRPEVSIKPIASTKSLAAALRINEGALVRMAKEASSLYDAFDIPKRDGKTRNIKSPRRDLKLIQKRINRIIFEPVRYPQYLFGGIQERDYVQNAAAHANAKSIISLDVKNFYTNIKSAHVQQIFKNFFRFPPEVANTLTSLCTLDGCVPQGACTSSYIANLAFFDLEYRLAKDLFDTGIRYSRLLDDISISSSSRVFGTSETKKIIDRVAALLKTRGMHLKNSKTTISTASNPQTLMEVTGLWLNRGHPRVRRSERHDIRKDLRKLKSAFAVSRHNKDYHSDHNRISGRVAKLSHLKHFEASSYRNTLQKILPHYDQMECIRTSRQVHSLAKTESSKRSTMDYIDKFFSIRYKIGIIRRSNKSLATILNAKLKRCQPTCSKEKLIYG